MAAGGKLIVFEGLDGCGKSSQARLCAERCRATGQTVMELREPGGTVLGEALRAVLLDPSTQAGAVAELLLYQASRAQLIEERIRPALAAGQVVILDRFWYSTVAYQGHGLGLDLGLVRSAIRAAVGDLRPDAVLWLQLDPAVCAARRAGVAEDRIEARGLEYLRRVDAGYRALAAAGELMAIDAAGTPDEVAARVMAALA